MMVIADQTLIKLRESAENIYEQIPESDSQYERATEIIDRIMSQEDVDIEVPRALCHELMTLMLGR